MCGFVGALGGAHMAMADSARATLVSMAERIRTRGPDDAGCWIDAANSVGLAHRRLAIVDLSAAGHQPMHSTSGRYVMVYNGEIYNHRDLRARVEPLAKSAWRGHSDSEVLLACIEAWGVEAALRQCVGMFAIAIWDCRTLTLTLARDRVGEKPLYYGWVGQSFVFASELKALRTFPGFSAPIERDAIGHLVQFGYIPTPTTVYQGIKKLAPGTTLSISQADTASVPRTYWSLAEATREARACPFIGSDVAAADMLEYELKRCISQQLVADVPVGVFLSSGVDASLIAALGSKLSATPLRTFSIGFSAHQYDEAGRARAIAAHLGTQHAELYVTDEDALDVVTKLPQIYCEPLADSSEIPTRLLCEFVRREGVTVALTGDGGDELFCGYPRYLQHSASWQRLAKVPDSLRDPFARPHQQRPVLPQALGQWFAASNAWYRYGKAGRAARARRPAEFYERMLSAFQPISRLVKGTSPQSLSSWALSQVGNWGQPLDEIIVYDSLTSLPDVLLTKVDRAAMSVSLETRSPFLNHRILELAWRLPPELKVRHGQTKWILRQLLARHLPETLRDPRKHGFNAPIHHWLRGKLKDWATALLDPSKLRQEGFFEAATVTQLWAVHQSGQRDWSNVLFPILMFQAWLDSTRLNLP